jgi:hypothetical protein
MATKIDGIVGNYRIAGIKTALGFLGFQGARPRRPQVPIPPDGIAQIEAVLRETNLVG